MKYISLLSLFQRRTCLSLIVAGACSSSLLVGSAFAQTAPGGGVFQDTILQQGGSVPSSLVPATGSGSRVPFPGSGTRAPLQSGLSQGSLQAPTPATVGVQSVTGQLAPISGAVIESTSAPSLNKVLGQPAAIPTAPATPGWSSPVPMGSSFQSHHTPGDGSLVSGQPVTSYGYADTTIDGTFIESPVQIGSAENFDVSEYTGCASCEGVGESTPAAFATSVQSDEVFQPAVTAGRGANNLFGISGLAFGINDGDSDRLLTRNNSRQLGTNSVDQDDLDGVEAVFARRKSNGSGFELRYFNLSADNSDFLVDNPSVAYAGSGFVGNVILPSKGLSGIGFGGVPAETVFNDAASHTVSRDTNINNFEINWLRRGRSSGRRSVEYLVGFRYFQFEDSLGFAANDIGQSSIPGHVNPTFANYVSDVENDLYGIQLGRRMQISLVNRVSLFFGVTGGVFNNRVTSHQNARYIFADGSSVIPQALQGRDAGTPISFETESDHIALLGEVDLGLVYQISSRMRARIGYRGIGVSDVAFAGDQLQDHVFDTKSFQNIDKDANLILNGGYAGIEFAW